MKFNFLRGGLILCLLVSIQSCAQSKASFSSGKDYAAVLSASSQRTVPGRAEQEPVVQHKFLVKWKSKRTPETFFWKGENTWMICSIERYSKNIASNSEVNAYRVEEISPEKVKKGDTLQLVPVKGGKFPIPLEVPSDMHNLIVFKTTKSKWMYLAVKRFQSLPDIILQ